MQLPTNYKMGTGLAATIMGQQAGLEQEKMGLQNLYSAMEMPGNILKGEEQAALLNDPRYLQQKTANTLIELGNQFDANQFQKALNDFGRFKLQLQAAGGDPQKVQQIVTSGLDQLGVSPSDPFYAYALKNPDKAIDQMIQGAESQLARAGGPKFAGERALQTQKDEAAMQREIYKGIQEFKKAQLQAQQGDGMASMTKMEAYYRQRLAKDPNDKEAQAFLERLDQSKLYGNPAAGSMTVDPRTGKLVPKGSVVQSIKPTPVPSNTPAPPPPAGYKPIS